MTISIIIPIYNVEQYIQRCLESVIKQKCNGFDVECVLIDDCSPDHSMDIVHEMISVYLGHSIHFVTLHHHINQGISAARNTGIRAAKGDFLLFMDSDDLLTEDALQILFTSFQKHDQADVVMGNVWFEEESQQKNRTIDNGIDSVTFLRDRNDIITLLLKRKINRYAWNKLLSRSFVLEHELFFDEGMLYEDVVWLYKLYNCVSSVLLLPDVTYIYAYNPSSIVHTHEKRAEQIVKSFICISDYVFRHPPVNDNTDYYINHRLFVYHWMLIASDKQKKLKTHQGLKKLVGLKRELFFDAVSHYHPLMALYTLVLFAPLKYMVRYKWFRRCLYYYVQMLDRLNG